MNIRYKRIEHERTEDAPFVGALICAIDCKFNCKQCFNRKIKAEETLVSTEKEIIKEVLSNPLNEGIILSGLEWSLQPVEMLALCKEAKENDLEVIIYTGCELKEFHERIGKAFCGELDVSEVVKEDERDYMLAMSGSLILDEHTPEEYYIKCGRYDNTKKCQKTQFGVTLSSENQAIYKFVREE